MTASIPDSSVGRDWGRLELPKAPARGAAARASAARRYRSLFLTLLLLTGVLYLSLHYFMLVTFADNFLETNWLAQSDNRYHALLALAGVLFACHIGASCRPRLSDRFVTLLVAVPILPMLMLYQDRGAPTLYMALCLGCLGVIWAANRIVNFDIGAPGLEVVWPIALVWTTIALCFVFLVGSAVSGNLDYLNFDITKVYDYRADAQLSRTPLLDYLVTNLTATLLPLSIAICLDGRRYTLLAVLAVLNVVIFGFTSMKSHLAIIIFVIGVYGAFRIDGLRGVLLLFSAVLFGSLAIHLFAPRFDLIPTLTIRRTFYVPAYANFLYYDFFNHGPHFHWSDAKITFGMVANPYGSNMNMPLVIMAAYGGQSLEWVLTHYAHANTGFLGSGYGQAGPWGMLLYSVLIVGMLKVGETIARKLGPAVAFAGLSHYFVTIVFASTDFTTTILSYGTVLLVLLALFLKPLAPRTAPAAANKAGAGSTALVA